MNRVIKMILLSLFIMLVGTSCSTTSTASRAVWGPAVYVDDGNLESEISVGGRIEGEGSATYILGFIPVGNTFKVEGVWGGGIGSFLTDFMDPQDAKMEATYDAIASSGADMIVEPRYQVKETNFLLWRHVTARVWGFKGNIDSFTQYKQDKPSFMEETYGYPPVEGATLKIENK